MSLSDASDPSTPRLDQRRIAQHESRAAALDTKSGEDLQALAARVDADPSLWQQLGTEQKLSLGYIREARKSADALNNTAN